MQTENAKISEYNFSVHNLSQHILNHRLDGLKCGKKGILTFFFQNRKKKKANSTLFPECEVNECYETVHFLGFLQGGSCFLQNN